MLADLSLGCRGDDGLREALVLAHALRQLHATDLADTALVGTPSATAQVTAYDHLDGEALTHDANRYHRIRSSQFPVRADIGCRVEELGGDLVQHLAFVRDAFRQDHVERRDTVCSDHHQLLVVNVIHVAYLTVVHACLLREIEVCLN